MGLFYKPKYIGYCFSIQNYRVGLEFQDSVVRDANEKYNLDLQEPFTYECKFRKNGMPIPVELHAVPLQTARSAAS